MLFRSEKKYCITLDDVKEARNRIKDEVLETQLDHSTNLSNVCGCNLSLKLENFQKCKSFKFRGAYNKIKTLPKGSTVVAVSGGNHSQGVALASKLCDCKSIVYVPEFASNSKIDATLHYGGQVVKKGSTYAESNQIMENDLMHHADWVTVPEANDPLVIAGAGTIGLEILEKNPDVETIVIPIGGGGLISGVAYTIKQIKPEVRIIGVQTASCPVVYKAFNQKKKKISETTPKNPLTPVADGLAVETIGDLILDIIYDFVDDIVLVSDDDIAQAVVMLAERQKFVVEGAGAASFAAVLSKKFSFEENENICCILSGGNIELKVLCRCIDRALFLKKTRRYMDVICPYGTSNYSALYDILINNGVEVISTVSLPHVDTYANKEHYSLTIDVPSPASFNKMENEIKEHGWSISVADPTAYDI